MGIARPPAGSITVEGEKLPAGTIRCMARAPLRYVIHFLRQTAVAGHATDPDLLRRFVAARDPSAFAALVRRHGPMVFGVCRRILRNHQDAEDAFQATFLVLARKAGTVRRTASLSAWLHSVAFRVALRARRTARWRELLRNLPPPPAPPAPPAELASREALAALDEELQRLPDAFRLPLVLCCLEGLTQE